MIELDPSLFAPEITYVLMLRGAGLPSMRWAERPNEAARKHLEGMNDQSLFGRAELVDERMAAAARGLLYLWTGWAEKCVGMARYAHPSEKNYLLGLAYRHLGHPDEAKQFFREMADGHPIYESLAHYVLEAVSSEGTGNHKILTRFRQLIEFDPIWEPFTFVDICSLGLSGELDRSNEEIVRKLQMREWELLFEYCYEGGTGEKIPKKVVARTDEVDRRRIRERKRAEMKRKERNYKLDEHQIAKVQGTSGTNTRPQRTTPAGTVPVRCPKCKFVQHVLETMCGEVVQCMKCSSPYSVPRRPEATGSKK